MNVSDWCIRNPIPAIMLFMMTSQVSDLELSSGPAVIDRYNSSRNISFEVELSGLPLGDSDSYFRSPMAVAVIDALVALCRQSIRC